LNGEKIQIISMEYKQLIRLRSQIFVSTAIVLGCLFLSKSAFSQNVNLMNLLNSVTDQQYSNEPSGHDSLNVAVEICPHPANQEISVALALRQHSEVTVSLVNLDGRKVGQSQKNIQLTPGNTILNFSVCDIRRGAYLILIDINGYVHTRLVKIQKTKSQEVIRKFFGPDYQVSTKSTLQKRKPG